MRILIAEDDSISRRILQTTLANWGHEVVVTCDGQEAWDVLQRDDAPNLAILDWMMPGMDGAEICRRVRTRDQHDCPYMYLVLLTARGRKEDIVEGMDAGADDYITKPFDSGELRVRLIAAERILKLEGRLFEMQESLREQATHDFLTALWNRRAILDILKNELIRAGREDRSVGVIVVDIDHLKQVNDVHGHHAGDAVITEIAGILKANLRGYDCVGRYGGDEFLIVMPGCELETAASRATALRATLEEATIKHSGKEFSLTACMGVAAASGLGGPEEIDRIIKAADEAMYQAKRSGRNRVETASKVA